MTKLTLRLWRNIGLAVLAGAGVFVLGEGYDAALRDVAFMSGWILLAVILVLAFYRVRKAITVLPIGANSIWVQLHFVLGILAIALFGVHVGWRWPTGSLEVTMAIIFILVALSGILGLFMSRTMPRRLTRRGEEVILERIPIFRRRLREEGEALVLQNAQDAKSSTLRDFYIERLHPFFAGRRNFFLHLMFSNRELFTLQRELDNLERYLTPVELPVVAQLRELVQQKDDLDFHEALQTSLRAWLLAHVPLTYGLLLLIAAHLILVHAFAGAG